MGKSILEKEIVKLYSEDGMGIQPIADKLGTNFHVVRNLLIKLGIKKQQVLWSDFPEEKVKEIIDLYSDQSQTVSSVAKTLNIGRAQIETILKRNKVKIRRGVPDDPQAFEKEVIHLYCDEKMTCVEVAGKLNVPYQRVRTLLSKLDLIRPPLHPEVIVPDDLVEKILEKYSITHETISSVADFFELSYHIARKVLLNNDVKIRCSPTDDPNREFTRGGLDYKDILEKIEEMNHNYLAVSRFFNCSDKVVADTAKRFGIYKPVRKTSYKENFFEKIDSHEKAYILGLWAGDGNVSNHDASISLWDLDTELLSKVRDVVAPDRRLLFHEQNGTKYCSLNIGNKKMRDDMESKGIVENKTFQLKIEDWMTGEFANSAILGLHDADGSFYFKDNGPKGKAWVFSFIGMRCLCEFMQKTFKNVLGINSSVKPHTRYKDNEEKPLYTIRVTGNLQAKILMDWLYKDCSIFMKRKHDKYLDLCDFLLHKRKNQFC